MLIAQNLRQLRIARSITQEELAERIGVTGQAVSKWERGDCYPDITLLPGLANYFGVTVDKLIGMEEINKMKETGVIMSEICRLHKDGRHREAVEYIEGILRQHPGEDMTLTLAQSLAMAGEVSERVVRMLEDVVKPKVNEKRTASAIASLCFAYRAVGDREKAARMSLARPHCWEARELLHPKFLEGAEKEAYMRRWLPRVLVDMALTIRGDDVDAWGLRSIFDCDIGGMMSVGEAMDEIKEFLSV